MQLKLTALFIFATMTATTYAAGLQMSHMMTVTPPSRLKKNISFQENWSRYPSPDVILNKLRQDFPTANLMFTSECQVLTKANRSLLGDSQPMTGRPAVDSPNSSFINWYGSCVVSLIQQETNAAAELAGEPAFIANNGGTALNECKASFDADVAKEQAEYQAQMKVYREYLETVKRETAEEAAAWTKARKSDPHGKKPMQSKMKAQFMFEPSAPYAKTFEPKMCEWNKLSPEGKGRIINSYLEKYIGPEDVIIDLGLAESEKELSDTLRTYIDGFAAAPTDKFNFLIYVTPNASYFLTTDAVLMMKLLIHLEDINKY
jgi:hypothetical protein